MNVLIFDDKGELKFSYYTDLEPSNLQDIVKKMITMFKEMCNEFDYFDKLNSVEVKFNSLELEHRKK